MTILIQNKKGKNSKIFLRTKNQTIKIYIEN